MKTNKTTATSQNPIYRHEWGNKIKLNGYVNSNMHQNALMLSQNQWNTYWKLQDNQRLAFEWLIYDAA